MYVLELTIVIKGDDKLELEAIQEAISSNVQIVAAPLSTEIVGQPILPEVSDVEKDA